MGSWHEILCSLLAGIAKEMVFLPTSEIAVPTLDSRVLSAIMAIWVMCEFAVLFLTTNVTVQKVP